VQTFDTLTKAQKNTTFCARFVCQTNAQAVTVSRVCRHRSSHVTCEVEVTTYLERHSTGNV